MQFKEIAIQPLTHQIHSHKRQDMPVWLAISELVDNSLDANASVVEVQFNKEHKSVLIKDNGAGAPNPTGIVQFGYHENENRNTSGQFGIGAKDGILALGTMVTIVSRRGGVMKTVKADFDEIIQRGEWVCRLAEEDCDQNESGTEILIGNVSKHFYLKSLMHRLAVIFAPALRTARRVTVDGVDVDAPSKVQLEHAVEGEGVFQGKAYRFKAGIIAPEQNVSGGWRYEFKHRTLEETSLNRAFGTGSHDISKFYGVITLIERDDADRCEKWSVNKHKTNAEELEALCEEIFPSVEHLLQQSAAEHSLTIEAEIEHDVAASIEEAISITPNVREKRKSSERDDDGEGAVPRDTGKRRRRVSSAQSGDKNLIIKGKLNGKKFAIKFDDTNKLASVTGNRTSNVVYLGRNHPYWELYKENRDVVLGLAMAFLVGHAITTDGDQPIMSAIVSCDSSNAAFFNSMDSIAKFHALQKSSDQAQAV